MFLALKCHFEQGLVKEHYPLLQLVLTGAPQWQIYWSLNSLTCLLVNAGWQLGLWLGLPWTPSCSLSIYSGRSSKMLAITIYHSVQEFVSQEGAWWKMHHRISPFFSSAVALKTTAHIPGNSRRKTDSIHKELSLFELPGDLVE